MPFDFSKVLSRIDPAQNYFIHEIAGGVVNFTVRAVKVQTHDLDGSNKGYFPDHESLILKHAPPYIASIGEVAPMSPYRQVVEARALSFLKQPFMHQIAEKYSIKTPQVLYHDLEDSVLILSDLGVLPTLSEYLLSLSTAHGVFQDNVTSANEVGRRIGRFLFELHSLETLNQISLDMLESFSNPSRTSQSSINGVVSTVGNHLKLFSTPHTEVLATRVRENLQRRTTVQEIGFVNGDLSTGAILLTPPPLNQAATTVTMNTDFLTFGPTAVIDFEFAGPGRTINGDIAQLSALLQLHLMCLPLNSASHKIADAIGRGIVTAYRDKYRADHPQWSMYLRQQIPQSQAEKEGTISKSWVPQPPQANSGVARIMRSAFICHGAEMVNNALWKEWPCLCCDASDLPPRTTEQKLGCELVRAMVGSGTWYLESAMGNEVEFVEEGHWYGMWRTAAGLMKELLIGLDE